ncbi:RHS repeat-associated core domain-containing protein [Endothiovibrio diazotrophicus]
MDRALRLLPLFALLLLALLGARPAAACSTYGTCNAIWPESQSAVPNPFTPGEPVTLQVTTFEYANWYWTVPSQMYTPLVLVDVAGQQLVGELTGAEYGPISSYGSPWTYSYWFNQYARFTHTVVWDGKDLAGNPATLPQTAFMTIFAGAQTTYAWVELEPVPTTANANDKDLGKPPCGSTVGDPCNAANGNVYHQAVDYSAPTGLTFTRSYNSQWSGDLGLGIGWSGDRFKRLEIEGTTITVRQGSGRGESFTGADGVWTGDPDSALRLTEALDGFTLHLPGGAQERYALDGRLFSERDPAGNATLYGYDAAGQLTSITDPDGHRLALIWGADGHLIGLTDPAGNRTSYYYDGEGRLTSVTYPDATTRGYRYDDPDAPVLSGIVDENGDRYVSYRYGGEGRVVETHFPDTGNGVPQERFTFDYAADGLSSTVTDANGTTIERHYLEQNGAHLLTELIDGADGSSYRHDYDAANNRVRSIDRAGVATAFRYNDTHQRIAVIEADGTPEARERTITYLDPDLDLPTRIKEPSVQDGALKVTRIDYNDALKPVTLTVEGFTPDGDPVSRSVALSYDDRGRLTASDGPRTDVDDTTTFSYYDCTDGGRCGRLASVTDSLGHTTTFDAYDANGRLQLTTAPDGLTTGYRYDTRGRLTEVIETPLEGAARTTTYGYDPAGQLTSLTTPDGATLRYHYDAAHDLTAVEDALGNRVGYSYDAAGNRTVERLRDPAGTLVQRIERGYDLRSRVTRINEADAITDRLLDAVGNLTGETDPNGNATAYSYDPLRRLSETVDALAGVTRYDYDVADRLASVTAPNGATTGYRYDDLGNRLEESSPDRGTTTYTYDAAGNRTSRTDARGITATYAYDAAGRLTAIDYPDTADDVAYTYDDCSGGLGRLCAIEQSHTRLSYAYDGFGRVSETTREEGDTTFATRYGYDAADRLTAVAYPDGREIHTPRDALGRITAVYSILDGVTTVLADQRSFDAAGRLTGQTFGNGLVESRRYDLRGRLTDEQLGSVAQRLLTYDANGNLLNQNVTSATYDYGYDALDRLIDETTPGGRIDYAYDANGNRTEDSTRGSYSYEADSNRLSAIAGSPVTLDAAGNTLTDAEGRVFTYDAAGRLSEVQSGNRTVLNRYDALGRRIAKAVVTGGRRAAGGNGHGNAYGLETAPGQNGGVNVNSNGNGNGAESLFHYDVAGRLIEETSADGRPLHAWVWADDQPVARIDLNADAHGTVRSEAILYLHTDHLATPRWATDATGRLVWRWQGDAFGAQPPETDPDGDGIDTEIALRFPGQYQDAETGLFYNYFRDYDPASGRYVESDPVGLDGGLNTYGYSGQNPVRWVDPRGLAFTPETAFDLISLGLSIDEYRREPSLLNGLGVAFDALGAAVPFLPAGIGIIRQCDNVAEGARNLPFSDDAIVREINEVLDRIENGSPMLYRKDGTQFFNREGKLPDGNYREYTVPTPGQSNRGARRIVRDENTGRTYYSNDHYRSFVEIDPRRH